MVKCVASIVAAMLALGGLIGAVPGFAAPAVEEIVTTGTPLARLADSSFSEDLWTVGDLASLPGRQLDRKLRFHPGFGLFRRHSSLVAHPSIQGGGLRHLGPNGAGRVLVLLDGVPQNDPFGGWVYWNGMEAADLESLSLVSGGGAGQWGQAALAGTINLSSRSPREGGWARLMVDSLTSLEMAASGGLDLDGVMLSLSGGYLDSVGHHLLSEEQRGSIDQKASLESRRIGGRLTVPLREQVTLAVGAGFYEEHRLNGLPSAPNDSRLYDGSFSLARRDSRLNWQFLLFGRSREFSNRFAATDERRTADRVVLDQFDMPAEMLGGSFLLQAPDLHPHHLEAGVDLRLLKGETHERFFFVAGVPNRERAAGGRQLFAGIFVEDRVTLGQSTTLTLGARLDYWRLYNGHRREWNLQDNRLIRDESFDERSGQIINGRVSMQHRFSPDSGLRVSAYTGFRVPTINELYRPFRVRTDITEANPQLDPERLYGIEVSGQHRFTEQGRLEVTFFYTRLNQAVANVTIGQGPGVIPPFGFVPGVLRQRQNLDRIASHGAEVRLKGDLGECLSYDLRYLYVRGRVEQSIAHAELDGKRLPQSPEHQGSILVNWQPAGRLDITLVARYGDGPFEDDLNTLRLNDLFSVDLALEYQAGADWQIGFEALNLLDRTLETGISSDGLVSIGQPRTFRLSIVKNY